MDEALMGERATPEVMEEVIAAAADVDLDTWSKIGVDEMVAAVIGATSETNGCCIIAGGTGNAPAEQDGAPLMTSENGTTRL